jgi:hypothetical protein
VVEGRGDDALELAKPEKAAASEEISARIPRRAEVSPERRASTARVDANTSLDRKGCALKLLARQLGSACEYEDTSNRERSIDDLARSIASTVWRPTSRARAIRSA